MIKFNYKWFVLCVIAAVFTLATAAEAVMWTWVGGSDATDQNGVYGTKGKAASGNVPGARSCGLSWTDANSIMWLFGGWSYDAAGDSNYLNDLWKFDGSNWTWVSGSNAISQKGVYGTKGVAASDNVPGARGYGVSWIDAQDNLWLFGGYGYDVNGDEEFLNDLWKFDGSNWIWVSGSNAISQKGVYGTKGVAASGNVPGARPCGLSWIDAEGNLWLFGGYGYDVNSNDGYLNDLWKFDGSNWTWVSGSNAISQKGVYGTKGVPASGNVPGARGYSVSWIDAQDNLWLFGGYGYSKSGEGELGDLWKVDMSVVVIAKCVVAAGKVQGQDNFSASGIIELPTTLDFNNVNHIDVNIVSSTGASIYPQTVDADVVNGKFQYKAKSRITSLAVDSKKGTFSITAKSIVLTGLSCPLWLKLTIGTDELSSITDESIVNGTKMLIPTRLMRTYDDKLVVNKAKAKLNSKKASSDTLSVTGDIAVIDTDVNLYNYDVNFVWGEEMFRVPSHSFKAAKTGHLYKCSKVVADASGNDGIVTAQLDLDKATFTLSVTGADDIDASSTSVSFGISFADFNETADVTLSTGRSW